MMFDLVNEVRTDWRGKLKRVVVMESEKKRACYCILTQY